MGADGKQGGGGGSGVATGYLVLYNLASCAGWAAVWWEVAQAVRSGSGAAGLWQRAALTLAVVQSLAALEVLHSVVRLVKSPVMTVVLQVGSRLVVLWVYTWFAAQCHSHWSLLMMVGSWASVEVPRYLFYALNLLPQFSGAKMPYPLFWLRYSLFMVLYPTGITGELLQISVALSTYYGRDSAAGRALFLFPFLAYIPFGPFMVLNMWGNRKAQFKKRREELAPKAAASKVEGLVWPVTDSSSGERSTTETNQEIWAAAVAGVDADAAERVRRERNWRFGYAKHIERQMRAALGSRKAAVQIAQDGLRKAMDSFEFVRDGKAMNFGAAMEHYKGSFSTGFVKGTAPRSVRECQVQYGGQTLKGEALMQQLERWVAEGTMEPTAANAVRAVMANPHWVDLSDRYFVLLGATSAMGPLDLLLACGANVIGIDLDRPGIWEKLIGKVRTSPGTLTFPLKKPQAQCASDQDLFDSAGANLLAATPEIANWLEKVCPGKPLAIGNYTYLDGALHVQLSIACDAIMDRVCRARKDTAIAFLCTPTDCHNVPREAHEAARRNYTQRPLWQRLAEPLFKLKPNTSKPVLNTDTKGELFLSDGITVNQGPNYALAKRMQHWRAVLAREQGHVVSSNVAPSTSTVSVTSNPLFAAAYEGFVLFRALEVMRPETSSTTMLALLINDLRNPSSAANPKVPLSNPMELFAHNAFHGGTFRTQYQIGTIGVVCVLYAYGRRYWPVLVTAHAGLAAMIAYIALGHKAFAAVL